MSNMNESLLKIDKLSAEKKIKLNKVIELQRKAWQVLGERTTYKSQDVEQIPEWMEARKLAAEVFDD